MGNWWEDDESQPCTCVAALVRNTDCKRHGIFARLARKAIASAGEKRHG